MEGSILRWESGQGKTKAGHAEKVEESTRFATFLGRSRTALKMLEQTLGNFEDEEGEGAPAAVLTAKSAVPLLRDLSLDPATICKIASSLSRFEKSHPEIGGSWTFLRVAVRLLTAKNAQILRESSLRDVAELCNTCASDDVSGPGRDFITRLYARRVVQHLNNLLNDPSVDKVTMPEILSLSPADVTRLLWSLGELSVRYAKTDESRSTAYKRLRLVTDKTILSGKQLESLSLESTVQLLHGVVATQMVQMDAAFVRLVISELEKKLSDEAAILDMSTAVSVTECVVRLRTAVGNIEKPINRKPPPQKKEETETKADEEGDTDGEEAAEEALIDKMADERILLSEIRDMCFTILKSVTKWSIGKVQDSSAADLRRLLTVFATLPFEADELVDCIEDEVTTRLQMLDELDGVDLEELLQRVANVSTASQDDGQERQSRLSSFKVGLQSLFSSAAQEEDFDDEDEQEEDDVETGSYGVQTVEDLAGLVEEGASAASRLESLMATFHKSTKKRVDLLIRCSEDGAVFELGRCQELLASYRRINFETKERHGRYDIDRRREIGKRVLTRLFL